MGKREDTEQQILESAIKLISKKGYNATKTNEIAELANTSEATLFKYFKTKKGLLTAVVNKAVEILGHELAYKPISMILSNYKEKSIDEIMDMVIEDRIALILKNHLLLKVLITEIQYHEDLRDIAMEKIARPIFKEFEIFMAYHKAKGNIDPELDNGVVMRIIVAGLFSNVLKRVIMDESFDKDALKIEMYQVKKIILKGISPN